MAVSEMKADTLNAKDNDQRTALHLALEEGRLARAEKLCSVKKVGKYLCVHVSMYVHTTYMTKQTINTCP